ncbi:MAG: iron-containing redox enzyme family protein [Minicystis sp.]
MPTKAPVCASTLSAPRGHARGATRGAGARPALTFALSAIRPPAGRPGRGEEKEIDLHNFETKKVRGAQLHRSGGRVCSPPSRLNLGARSKNVTQFEFPYARTELSEHGVAGRIEWLREVQASALSHPVFNHPFLLDLSRGAHSAEATRFGLIQFSKHVRVFTSALGYLVGQAPDVRARFVLMDNLYEELGQGRLEGAHYMLYLRMLRSIGVSQDRAEGTPALGSLVRLNESLMRAISTGFVPGLAWLGIGGELSIPYNFPYLLAGLRAHFPHADASFFDRHGGVDQEHSDDAGALLALYMRPGDEALVEREAHASLDARQEVWAELAVGCAELSKAGIHRAPFGACTPAAPGA